jgi:hypothetical protein
LGEIAKRGAERSERSETPGSKPVRRIRQRCQSSRRALRQPARAARRGGNWRKPPVQRLCSGNCPHFPCLTFGCTPKLNIDIACGNCGNWFPPVRSLRFAAGDLHLLRPPGALLAIPRGALLEAGRLGIERERVGSAARDRAGGTRGCGTMPCPSAEGPWAFRVARAMRHS